MEILIFILFVWPVMVTVAGLVCNDKCLIPGTTNYRRKQLMIAEQVALERARTAVIEARYRVKENETLDLIAQRQIEAA